MCQPKSKGGERCLAHSSFSKFVMRATKTKTNADDATIKQTMKELSKEGKDLPDVSPAEATAWVDTKRFATELDPDLDSHERTIQLAQLERAREEAKNGVKGSRFHVWKNLMKRVASKMKKPLIAVGLIGSIAFGAAGCAQPAPSNPNGSGAPTSSPSSSSQPVDPARTYGDVIALKEVTDDKGTYQQTTVSDSDDSMQYDASKVDQTAYDAGFSDTDLESAQKWTAKFVAEQQADSGAVDSDAGWEAWKENEGRQYIAAGTYDSIMTPAPGGDRSAVIYNNPSSSVPPLIRDGAPRIRDEKITVTGLSGGNDPSEGNYVWVSGTTETNYRATDEAALAFVKKQNPDASEQLLKETVPGLFDGKENAYKVNITWGYALVKSGDSWKLGGYNTDVKSGGFVEAQQK